MASGIFPSDIRPADAPLKAIRVSAAAGNPQRGWLTMGPLTVPVALGRGGIKANKREGDAGRTIMVDLDDEIIEVIRAREAVAALVLIQPQRLVIMAA